MSGTEAYALGYTYPYALKYKDRFIILSCAILFSPLLYQYTGAPIFKVLDDALFVFLMVDGLLRKPRFRFSSDWMWAGYGVLLFLIISTGISLYHGNRPAVILLQFRQYKYLFLFLLLQFYHSETVYRQVMGIVNFVAYLSVPVAILQRLLINDSSGDVVTGILGYNQSGSLTLLLMTLFFSEFTMRLKQDLPVRGHYWILLVPVAINETKIAFLLFPVLVLFALHIARRLNVKKVVLYCMLTISILIAGNHYYRILYKQNVWDVFSQTAFRQYFFTEWEADIGRFLKVYIAYKLIDRHPVTRLTGYGTGASFWGEESGYLGVVAAQFRSAVNLFGGTRPQLFNLLIDTGMAGVVLMYTFFLYLFRQVYFRQEYAYPDIVAMFGLIAVIAGLFYQSILSTSTLMFVFMFNVYHSLLCSRYRVIQPGSASEAALTGEVP